MSKYIEIADADDYFNNRLNSQVWYDADDVDKSRALETATRAMERLNYAGEVTDSTQDLQFPRGGDTEIPESIKQACCELAYALLDGVDPEYESQNLDMTASGYGQVRSTYDRSTKPAHILAGIPSIVAWRLILPFLRDSRSITVTREEGGLYEFAYQGYGIDL